LYVFCNLPSNKKTIEIVFSVIVWTCLVFGNLFSILWTVAKLRSKLTIKSVQNSIVHINRLALFIVTNIPTFYICAARLLGKEVRFDLAS
jgi:hypothetical protein